MPSRYSSSIVSPLPVERCFENLRQSILQVIHHEHVSDEVRSFLAELVEAVLQHAEQTNGSSSAKWRGAGVVRPFSLGVDPWLRHQKVDDPIQDRSISRDSPDPLGIYQLEFRPQSGTLQVINSVTGKTLILSLQDLIRWAEQQGIDLS